MSIEITVDYAKVYALGAIGREATFSGDISPQRILEELFTSVKDAQSAYTKGVALCKNKLTSISFNLRTKEWEQTPASQQSIDVLTLGILLDDWHWINKVNPFERNRK
jgi:hypothetical protein